MPAQLEGGDERIDPADAEFEALIARLRPFFLESARAAVVEAVAAVPVPTQKPATVQGVDSVTRSATVLIDGDVDAIVAQVLTELPGLADRVMVTFFPPSAVFVTGLITVAGIPAGVIATYAGPITAHAGAVQTSATPGQPPRGWLWCAGQAVSRSTYSALYNAVGTTYGVGDGATTFNVPDLRGRMIVGVDNMGGSDAGRLSSSNTLGTTGGAETHASVIDHTHSTPNHSHASGTLAAASHSHTVNSHTHDLSNHTHSSPDGTSFWTQDSSTVIGSGVNFSANNGAGSNTQGPSNNTSGSTSPGTNSQSPSVSGSTASDGSGTTGSTGSGSTVNHMPPFMTLHHIIKA